MTAPDILSVKVIKGETMLAHAGKAAEDIAEHSQELAIIDVLETGSPLLEYAGSVITRQGPLIHEDEVLGTLEIVFSRAFIRDFCGTFQSTNIAFRKYVYTCPGCQP